jgi:WW domain-containing oxidoreductase
MIPRASSRTRKLDEARLSSVDLAGKTALVTGATSGLGEATARALAARGARVVLGVRDLRAGARVAREIRDSIEGCPEDRVVVPTTPLDLASNASVAAFAREVSSTHAPSLDVLVNNAGVNFLPESFTPEGIGVIAQINFLGPAVLTRLLEEPLSRAAERSGVAAVVHVSSVTHRYAAIAPDASAFLRTWEHGSYAASKLANVVFANECQRRWWEAGKRIVSVAVDPGAVFSNLWLRDAFFSKPPALFLLRTLYAPPTDGATAVVLACLAPFHEEGNEKSVDAEERGNADLSDGCDGSDANPKTSAAEAAAAMAGAYFPRDIPRESPKTKTKASLVRTFEQETLCSFVSVPLLRPRLVRHQTGRPMGTERLARRQVARRENEVVRALRSLGRRDAAVHGAGLADETFVPYHGRGAFLARVVRRAHGRGAVGGGGRSRGAGGAVARAYSSYSRKNAHA